MSDNRKEMVNGSGDLWSEVVKEGVEDRVEVNQRMLIDKMLARYSSDFVVLRELIQNSDDAQSTSFTLDIFCDPPSTNVNYQDIDEETNVKQSNYFLENLGQLLKNHLTTTPTTTSERTDPSEVQFDNCLINEIRTSNNGKIFTEDDWKRVITIAEGNTNVDAIGQFGVGFFSVFSYSEKPMIQSGKHCLAFAWQNGKSLTTFRKELPSESQSTSIILQMKNKFLLQTKPPTPVTQGTNKKGKVSHSRRTKSKKNVLTNEIIPTLDLNQLKSYFVKVLSFTKYLNELTIRVNHCPVFQVNKTRKSIESTKLALAAKRLNGNDDHHLFRLNSFVQTEQTFSIVNGPSITLNHIDVETKVTIEKEFHQQIEGVLKKKLPNVIHIEFLFPSNQIFEEEQWKVLTTNDVQNVMLKNLIPLKLVEKRIHPDGQIFIGLATHQSTGIGMHVYSHLIPTIERENLDLQDPYISIWNEQLLLAIGKILRFIYDQTILDLVNQLDEQCHQRFHSILSPYAFQQSSPNKEIGRILVDGFFSSDKDILVPVRRSPMDAHLSLIPSTEAYLTHSKHVEKFLPIPLVPYDIGQNDFFQILKRRQWIEEIDDEIIVRKVHESILLFEELIQLLRWLCTNEVNDRALTKEILSKIRFRHTVKSNVIQLDHVEYFDTFNHGCLPLPNNVLPTEIVSHLSREDLQRRLSLSAISIRQLLEFYLQEKQRNLFTDQKTSAILLHLIGQHLKKFNAKEIEHIEKTLSQLRCIPTSQGMKLPNDSYIPSESLASHLPLITLFIPQLSTHSKEQSQDSPVSMDFLKSIGCRTIHIPTLTNSTGNPQENLPVDSSQNNSTFVQQLVQQRKNLSDNDLRALKSTHCLLGTTLQSNGELKRKSLPHELHFPFVAQRLQWPSLVILDWMGELDPRSAEYAFLKELGVREVPDLPKLLARLEQEHASLPSKSRVDYQLPHSLIFLAENFQIHYSKIWKNSQMKASFLPSVSPHINQSGEVSLMAPENVFKEYGPLCSSLLPDVLRCFSQYFDIGLLGVKHRPTISIAFDVLMAKRNELLTVQSAPIYFAYLTKLDGLNKAFIDQICKRAFIPLPGTNQYLKPNQVFLRTKTTKSTPTTPDVNVDTVEELATRGLIDYVDYGHEGNAFLTSIGVVCYPSAENLAQLLMERQATYFASNNENTKEVLAAKLRLYTNCLKQLAVVCHVAREFHSEPLKSRLRSEAWCLGYQTINNSNGNQERIFRIAKPNEIFLDDDHQSSIDLQPLCAPDEPELTKLYEQFGARWISESVQRTLVHRGKIFVTDRSQQLQRLIEHRLDMLFVNNRGERMENVEEKRIELLRKKFGVYESEGIQCQLTFEKKTITLNSTECSSCALESSKNEVNLFLHQGLPTLDYIDIASELTRYVYKKPIHSLVHSISDKLASPLETLKRRGIPVDRLLKIQQQQQPLQLPLQVQSSQPEERPMVKQVSQPSPAKKVSPPSEQLPTLSHPQPLTSHRPSLSEHNEQQVQRGFFQSLKELIAPFQFPSPSTPTNPIENLSSEVQSNRVAHFGQYKCEDEQDITKMLGTSRPYSQNEFRQDECSRRETNNSCEYIPSSNMIRYSTLFHAIPLYIDHDVLFTDRMIEQSEHLAWLLSSLAKQVFRIPIQSMHLFRDIDSARIAFNSNGSIFYNLRYFEQVYWDDLKPCLNGNGTSSNAIVRRIVNFYYMVTCHELSHNIDSNHDLNFINRLERVSARFMDQRDAFISTFAFQ